MGYDYRSNVDTDGELTWAVSKEYYLVGKLNHEIFYILQWMLPNVMADRVKTCSIQFHLEKNTCCSIQSKCQPHLGNTPIRNIGL